MKRLHSLFCLALVLGFLSAGPPILRAAEHGGKEHAGQGTTGATGAAGGGALAPAENEDAEHAVMLEAADALEATRPDLAAKLRDLAKD